MYQTLFAYLLRKFWSALVIITVSAAVIVSLLRIMLPGIGEHRGQIQAWVSQSLGQPVDIGQIEADWSGWTPNLRLTNISLLDRERQRSITRFATLTISIDILSSVYQRRFVPGHLLVTGVELSLIRMADGSVTIEGVSRDEENTTSLEKNALAYWLEQQSDLAIQSARVSWNDQILKQPPITFDEVSLVLQNRGNHHRFKGSARLSEETESAVVFILDAHGDLLTRGWEGQLFVEAAGLNPDELLAHSGTTKIRPLGGSLRFRLWSDWKNARLESITADFHAENMLLGSETSPLSLIAARGELKADRGAGHRWDIIAQKLSLQTLNGTWPDTGLSMQIENGPEGALKINTQLDFIRLEDLLPALSSFNLFTDKTLDYLQQTSPQGDLHQLQLVFDSQAEEKNRFSLHTDFNDLRIRALETSPGVNGLDGSIAVFPQHGSLKLQTHALQTRLPHIFREPIWLDELNGVINWQQQDTGWHISTEHLHLVSSDLDASLRGELDWHSEGRPVVNLLANFKRGNVQSVGRYLPYSVMSETAIDWLGGALVGGKVVGGGMLLRGDLAHFPFADHSGVFEVRVQVEDGILDYASDWPRIEEIEAEVVFSGSRMDINAVAGKVYDASIQQATASIDNLRDAQQVIIEGSLKGDVLAGYEFISNSPLKNTVGKRLDRIALSNEIKVDLRLEIPLRNKDRKVSTSGRIYFEENLAIQPRFGITLEKLRGSYSFTDDSVADGEFSALYHKTPVKLVIRNSADHQATVIDLRGSATPQFIKDRLSESAPGAGQWLEKSGLFAVLEGKTAWRAKMKLPIDENNPKQPASLEISADLRGMSVDAPSPLGKDRQQSFPFKIYTPLGDQQDKNINFSYSDILSGKFHLIAARDGYELKRTEIHLGKQRHPQNNSDSLWIGGHLAELDLSRWIDFYRQQNNSDEQTGEGFPPTSIDLGVEQLKGYGQSFDNVNVQASNPAGEWQIALDGEQAHGRIKIPADLQTGVVSLDFPYLALNNQPSGEKGPSQQIDPRRFPAVQARIEKLRFNDGEMGKVNLASHTETDGLSIDRLEIDNEAFSLSADGHWLVRNGEHQSHLNMAVEAPALQGLLSHFGYNATSVEEAETSLVINAGWPGTLTDFSLENLNGKLRMDIKQGRFIDIDASAGKIFGLLSLQGLKRRLTLDFNDLFQKGFSFDHLNASFILENGHAYTNDMLMEGPSATISINGRTGLVEQDYDQLVTVTPAFASSLPVASALFGPVGVGVGAVVLLVEKMFKGLPDSLDRVLTRQYSLTGSWQEPVIERLSGDAKDPEPPTPTQDR